MPRPKVLLLLADSAIAALGLYLALLLRFSSTALDPEQVQAPWSPILCLLTVLFISYVFELYDTRKFISRRFIFLHCAYVAITALAILSALFYVLPVLQFGRGILLLYLLLVGAGQIGLRLLIRQLARNIQFATRVFILGAGELAQTIYDIVPKDGNIHSFVRYVSCTRREPVVDPDFIVGKIDDIDELMQDYRPTKLIVALAERRGNLPLNMLMHFKLRGVEIIDAANYYEQVMGRLWVERIQPSSFVYAQGFRMTPIMRGWKRVCDVIFATLGLLMTAPLFPLLAVLIKLDSPGPVFFKQLRVGENELEYFIYKFRTMCLDAERSTGAVWAQKEDPRVTRIGAFMRKTRLDEIPQLYNVLKGDMSFIGPRPERMAFVERLKKIIPFYSTRHFIKPGVTGWAQIRYPYGATDEDALEKLRYDLYYIKNYSILLDLRIIIDTIRVVLTGFGGR